MKKASMWLTAAVAILVCVSSYARAGGIEDLKVVLKPVTTKGVTDKVELSLTNSGGEAVQGAVTLDVPQQWKVKPAVFFKFEIAPGKSMAKSWTFANALKNPYNKYKVKVKVSSGGSVLEKQIVIKGAKSASVNLGEPKKSGEIPASIFGTQTHFGQWWDYKKVIPLIEEVGFKWIKDEVYWGGVEREKGKLKIPAKATAWINDANKRGINVALGLVYGNKHYPFTKDNFEEFKKGYANYCAFLVTKLKGKVKRWEIWNEPSNFQIRKCFGGTWNAIEETQGKKCPWLRKYAELVIAAATAMRKADPNAEIIAAPDNPKAHYLLDIMKEQNAVHLIDGVSFHPYSYKMPPEIRPYGGKLNETRDGAVIADDDHSFSSEVRILKEKMKSVGMNSDNLYTTEFGYMSFHRTVDSIYEGFTESAQAKYLARQMILNLVNGIKMAVQYDFQDDKTSKSMQGGWGHCGLVRHPNHNYEPKPSFFALQRVFSLLSSPVKQSTNTAVAVIPDRYADSKNWKRVDAYMVWDGDELQGLNRVEKYIFTNGDNELILVLWNAVRESDRMALLTKNVIVGTNEYSNPLAIDIMTGETYDIKSEVKGKKTFLKDVVVPDYPIVIKMFKK